MDRNNCNIRQEFLNLECHRGWQPLFMEIREKSANFSITDAKKIENRDLNRYRDVNPFDHSRINITRGSCSYINASLVKVQAVDRMYILTQGPLSNTVSHFWAMVWEQSCKAIIMLNNVIEKNQVKCHTYWPVGMNNEHHLSLEDVRLSVELIEEDLKKNYIMRTFKMVDLDTQDTRLVYQYHYTTWPDFGVPAAPSDFLHFLMDIRNSGALGPGTPEEPVGPAVIHCSAGIGRSGTFCIVDTALLLLERGERVSVKDLVLEMRRYRMGLIQTAEQLRFSYLAIIEGGEPYMAANGESNPSESEESQSEDESSSGVEGSAEEVEEEDDVQCLVETVSASVASKVDGIEVQDDSPPPIPPRGESLISPDAAADYDMPLPPVPVGTKRTHPEMEQSTTTTSESDEEETGPEENPTEENLAGSGSELERKRRKAEAPQEETIPRTAACDSGNSELRHRSVQRQDRLERTQQLISSIKEKQKEAERSAEHYQRVRFTTKWMGIGVGIIVLICAGFRYFQD